MSSAPAPLNRTSALLEYAQGLKRLEEIEEEKLKITHNLRILSDTFPFLVEIQVDPKEKREQKNEDNKKGKRAAQNKKRREKLKEIKQKNKEGEGKDEELETSEEEKEEEDEEASKDSGKNEVQQSPAVSSQLETLNLGTPSLSSVQKRKRELEEAAEKVDKEFKDMEKRLGKKGKKEGGMAPSERSKLKHKDQQTEKNLTGNPEKIREDGEISV